MKNLIRKVLRAVRIAMKKVWNGTRGLAAFLTGRGGGAQPALEPEVTESMEVEDELAPDNSDDLTPYERKRHGFEPHDVRAYTAARTAEERDELGKRLTLKTKTWANALSEDEKKAIATASTPALRAHLDGSSNLPGVREVGIIAKLVRDPMTNPHGNGLASKLINEGQGRGRAFGKRTAAPEAVEASPDAPISFRAKQAEFQKKKARQRTETPRPPYRMINGKRAFGA